MLIEVFGEIINPEKVLYIKEAPSGNGCYLCFGMKNILASDDAIFFSQNAKEVMSEINNKWR